MRRRIPVFWTLIVSALVATALGTAVPSGQAAASDRVTTEQQATAGQQATTASQPTTTGQAIAESVGIVAQLTAQGPSADELRAQTETCGTQVSDGEYPERVGQDPSVPVCQKGEAIFWKSGMTIDCDGQRTDECNENTDQYFQPQTSCPQSDGEYLIASELPFVVVPLPSSIWDAQASGIDCGTVVAVVHEDRVVYGVMGDRGPDGQIGEGSYALAEQLGIDPDPSTGGISGRVVDYIAFPDVTAAPIEDHAVAESLGAEAANAFVNRDPSCDDVTVDSTAYDQLESGSEGDLVSVAQCLLGSSGFDPGEITGSFGESTATAVSDFQAEVGLAETGVLDAHTWTALLSAGSTPELRDGSSGEAVSRLQRALTAALGRTVDIDGQFGPNTEQAVRDYQSQVELDADGIVGSNTWTALQSGK